MVLRFNKKTLLITVGFLFSFLHWGAYALFLLGLLNYRKEHISGNIKALLIITVRTVIGPAVAASIGSAQIIKWLVIFILSFDILFHTEPFRFNDKTKKYFASFLAIFVVSNIITLVVYSSYPIVALFKLVSYVVPFYAVVNGIEKVGNKVDWNKFIIDILTPIMLASFVAIPVGQIRLVNGDFQGIIDHPNMMGVMTAIYIGLLAYKISMERMTFPRILLLSISFVMIYLTKSRTGMFAALIFCAVALLLCTRLGFIGKTVGIILIVVVTTALLFINEEWMEYITQFLYKRNTTDVFDSRREQEELFYSKFEGHELLGTGFMVPFYENYRNMQLSFSLNVEPGNLFFALLGDSGIIGALACCGYIGTVFLNSKKGIRMLLFVPIVLSMGEMAFFSTNNIAIIYYVIIGVCLSSAMRGGEMNENSDRCQ